MSPKKPMKKTHENKRLSNHENYEQIMNKIERKSRTNFMNFRKYVLVSICVVLIIVSIVIVQYNYNAKFKDDNKIDNDNDIEIKEPTYKKIPKEKIYTTVGGSENSWAFNVSDTGKILDNSDYVVKLTVLDIGKGTFDYSEGSFLPTTPISVKVLETFKGSNNNIDTIIQYGGYVTVRQVLDVSNEDRIQKFGWNKFSEKEKNELYMYFEATPTYNFQIGETYVVALVKGDDGYYMSANGYSIFKDDSTKSNIYSNVVTGNNLNLGN